MGRPSAIVKRQQDLAEAGEIKLTPRKKALLWMVEEPESITGPALSAARKGSGPRLAAESAGLTLAELNYMLALGEDGHPAYREFRDEFLRARAEPAVSIIDAVVQDATDPETRNEKNQRMALEITAPDVLGGGEGKRQDGDAIQTQNFSIHISEKFEPVPVVTQDVTDAEFEEAEVKSEIKVPVDWRPRGYQLGLWNAIISGEKKRAACVWHRRAGKDHEAINIIAVSMFKRPGTYWHVLPTYAQGEKAIWAGMDNDGRKFIDYIPKEAVESRRNDKMLLKVYDELGGAQYQVIGGDSPDRLMGANPVGVVFSEYALMNPMGWDLVRPILNANGGWAIFIYTPRGHNHGYDMMNRAKTSDKWYTETLDITQTRKHDGTPVVTEADVEEEIRAGMPEELARQEYYCDFSAPLVGAYYGREFDKIDKEGRTGDGWKWRKEYPVNTGWDLGIRDTMAIWFYQVIDGWVHWIDYEAGTGGGIEEYVKVLDRKPYVYKKHYAPHDVSKREIGTGTSVIETAARLGLRFTMVPRTRNLDDDINACRLVLARSRFATGSDERGQRVEHGVEALRQYRKEFDYKNKVWAVRPTHDWTSHAADAARTACVTMPREAYTIKEVPRFPLTETFEEALSRHDRVVAEGGKSSYKRL